MPEIAKGRTIAWFFVQLLLVLCSIEQTDSFVLPSAVMTRSSSSSTTTSTIGSIHHRQTTRTTRESSTSSVLQLHSVKQPSSSSPSSSDRDDSMLSPSHRTSSSSPHHRPPLPQNAAVRAVALVSVSTLLFPSLAHAAAITTLPSSLSLLANSITATGFYQAFSLVFLSELGDKTFFIAGLLAMKTSRWISFVGSIGALAVMTVLSVLIGQLFHAVPPGLANGIPLDDVCAVAAFLFFGIKILSEALAMEEGDESSTSVMDEELQEAKETVEETQAMFTRSSLSQIATIFGLVFAAELGDRSFLSTIALSAAQAPVAVACGAVAAHAVATGIAVASGAVVAKYLSERVIGIIGGSLFLVFAVTTAIGIF